MQLASSGLAGLGASPPPELLKALQYNPLLYYSYYAQMLTALQAQQKLLEMNNSSSANTNNINNNNNNNNNNNGSTNNIKDILSPLKLGNMAALNKESNQVKNPSLTITLFSFDILHINTACQLRAQLAQHCHQHSTAPRLSNLEAYILLCVQCCL